MVFFRLDLITSGTLWQEFTAGGLRLCNSAFLEHRQPQWKVRDPDTLMWNVRPDQINDRYTCVKGEHRNHIKSDPIQIFRISFCDIMKHDRHKLAEIAGGKCRCAGVFPNPTKTASLNRHRKRNGI